VLVIDSSSAVDTGDLRRVCLEIVLVVYIVSILNGRLTMPPASRMMEVKASRPDMTRFGMAVSQMAAIPTMATRVAKAPAKAQKAVVVGIDPICCQFAAWMDNPRTMIAKIIWRIRVMKVASMVAVL
jgi:hypothetical protein